MIQRMLNSFTNKVDVNLTLKYSIYLGVSLVVFAYPLNGNLTETLSANLGLKEFANMHTLYASNFDDKLTTDNVQIQTNNEFKLASCKYIGSSDSIVNSDYSILAVVNPNISLDKINYYDDLVYLRSYGIDTNEFVRLRKEPAEHLALMLAEAKNKGITTFISSGYRSLNDQVNAMEYWVNLAGQATATKYAAKPGHSEHHLGTTVDILTYENWQKLLPSYKNTKLFKWLVSNAHRYGFVESYPEHATKVTGYSYEPWHYRYVGVELATFLKDNNVLLQDHLYQLNGYCLVE